MATRTPKVKVSLLDNKIKILERKSADAPPGTQQVIQTVISGILTLVRDKMIADKYSVQLSDYCFGVCEVVKNLDESVSIELEDLGRVFGEIAQTIKRGSNVPRWEYDKDKIEGHKSEIQKILNALNAPTSSSPKESAVVPPLPDELVAQRPPIVSCDLTTASASQSAIRRLIGRDFLPHQLPSLIETICTCENSSGMIRSLTRDDAQTFIEVLDEALDRPDLSPSVRKQCLRPLYKTCGRHASLPKRLMIPICYDQTSGVSYSGGYADVWKGEHCGRDVAVKVIRRHSKSDLAKLVGRFCKEVVTWRTLHHPNVLGLIGVTMTETNFAMISEWMANGNIREFLEKNWGANRFKLLEDVATGLIYLHSQGMIHGDLKGANVLVDNTGHARLADFGLLKIISDPANPSSSSSCTQGGSTRWMSPELIDTRRFESKKKKKNRPTKSSDCYALGMLIYETITGTVPFQGEVTQTATLMILEGKHPPRGERFTNFLWETLEKCWKFQPNERPRIEDVLQCLEESSVLPAPHFPELDAEMHCYGGDSDSTNSSSGDLNPNADVRVTERAVASPGLGHLTSRQAGKARADNVGPETTTPDSHTRPPDSIIGGIRQDPLTTVGVVEVAGESSSDTRTRNPHQGSETTILDGTTEKNDKLREDGTSHDTFERIYQRLAENIERYAPNPQEKFLGICIPQRLYCQGTSIPVGGFAREILFAMADGPRFPAEFALAGRCDLLVDRDSAVFTEQGQTLNLRIEWPGYDGWGAQIRIVNYQEKPKSISRAKLATEIAKQLAKFIETKQSVTIDPSFEKFRVGPGGIELRHIGIAALEQVSRGSWQLRLIYNGLEEL